MFRLPPLLLIYTRAEGKLSRVCQLLGVTWYIIEITLKLLEIRGYQPAAKKERFLVKGSFGPFRMLRRSL